LSPKVNDIRALLDAEYIPGFKRSLIPFKGLPTLPADRMLKSEVHDGKSSQLFLPDAATMILSSPELSITNLVVSQ
jgi:hypothetical protein